MGHKEWIMTWQLDNNKWFQKLVLRKYPVLLKNEDNDQSANIQYTKIIVRISQKANTSYQGKNKDITTCLQTPAWGSDLHLYCPLNGERIKTAALESETQGCCSETSAREADWRVLAEWWQLASYCPWVPVQPEAVVWLEGGRATGNRDLGLFALGTIQYIANRDLRSWRCPWPLSAEWVSLSPSLWIFVCIRKTHSQTEKPEALKKRKAFSRVWVFETRWDVALQAPLSVGIFQERIL